MHKHLIFDSFVGTLNGPDIRKLRKSQEFRNVLVDNEINAWNAIEHVIDEFLGKTRSDNYQLHVQHMLEAFNKIGVNMSLKIHYLHHHLGYFGCQLSTESDEEGEKYHQTAMPFEIR